MMVDMCLARVHSKNLHPHAHCFDEIKQEALEKIRVSVISVRLRVNSQLFRFSSIEFDKLLADDLTFICVH